MKSIQTLLLILCLSFFCGCFPYRVPTSVVAHRLKNPSSDSNDWHQSISHPLYSVVPRHRCQIYWFDLPHWITWGMFGNDDDGLFGEESNFQKGRDPSLSKACGWWVRNSFHNFCFYVIGSAHRANSQFVLLGLSAHGVTLFQYHPIAKKMFPCKNSCFFFALNGWKPFVSARIAYSPCKRTEMYLGWRERGNFGAKFIPVKKDKSKKRKEECFLLKENISN